MLTEWRQRIKVYYIKFFLKDRREKNSQKRLLSSGHIDTNILILVISHGCVLHTDAS